MELQALRTLLSEILAGSSNTQQQVDGLRTACEAIERIHEKFRDVMGVPYLLGTSSRGHALSKLLAVIKDNEEAYEKVADIWVLGSGASLEQQAVGLRFLYVTLNCWGYQYPLTEDAFMERLVRWCAGSEGAGQASRQTTPTFHDPPPSSILELLEEERAVYSQGLLALSMSSIEYADDAVRTPAAPFAAQYLKWSLSNLTTAQDEQQQQPVPPPAADKDAAPASAPTAELTASQLASQTEQAGSSAPSSNSTDSLAQQAFTLRMLRLRFCCQFLSKLGEYVEVLAPILQEGGVETLVKLLLHYRNDPRVLYDTLDALCALLAHRRFAELFISANGVQLLLQIPRNQHSFNGLSLALYGLASQAEAFERVCMLPAPTSFQLVQAALQLLGSGYDAARKNASLFLGTTIHFRAILEAFDEQGGVRQLLASLRAILMLLSSNDTTLDLKIERQVAQYVCYALLQWLRSHCVIHIAGLRRSNLPIQPLSYKPVGDVGTEAMDGLLWSLDVNRRLAEAFARSPWPALEKFMSLGGVELLLEVVQEMQPLGERSNHELTVSALQMLQLAALLPVARKAIAGTIMPRTNRPGMGVLLTIAAHPSTTFLHPDYEVIGHALHVLVMCMAPPPSLASLLSCAQPESLPQEQPHSPASDTAAEADAAGTSTEGTAAIEGARIASTAAEPASEPATTAAVSGEQQQTSAAASRQPQPQPQTTQNTTTEGHVIAPVPSAAVRLANALEAGYAYARQCVRAGHGIRLLKQLLQPRPAAPSHFISQHAPAACALEKVRALAAQALLGMAREPQIRHVLSRLQVGRLLAELVRDPHNSLVSSNGAAGISGMGVPCTPAVPRVTGRPHNHSMGPHASAAEDSGTEAGGRASAIGEDEDQDRGPVARSRLSSVCGLPAAGGAKSWPEAFHRASMELIALTATNTAVMDRVAAAAHDAAGGGPALHRLEKAAIAAATPLTYAPQELLLIIYEHLRASGLHSAATTLAKEAQLHKVQQSLANMGVIAPPPHQLLLLNAQPAIPSSLTQTPQLPPTLHKGGGGGLEEGKHAAAEASASAGTKQKVGSRSRSRRRGRAAAAQPEGDKQLKAQGEGNAPQLLSFTPAPSHRQQAATPVIDLATTPQLTLQPTPGWASKAPTPSFPQPTPAFTHPTLHGSTAHKASNQPPQIPLSSHLQFSHKASNSQPRNNRSSDQHKSSAGAAYPQLLPCAALNATPQNQTPLPAVNKGSAAAAGEKNQQLQGQGEASVLTSDGGTRKSAGKVKGVKWEEAGGGVKREAGGVRKRESSRGRGSSSKKEGGQISEGEQGRSESREASEQQGKRRTRGESRRGSAGSGREGRRDGEQRGKRKATDEQERGNEGKRVVKQRAAQGTVNRESSAAVKAEEGQEGTASLMQPPAKRTPAAGQKQRKRQPQDQQPQLQQQQQPNQQQPQQQPPLTSSPKTKQRKQRHPDHPRSARHSRASGGDAQPFSYSNTPMNPPLFTPPLPTSSITPSLLPASLHSKHAHPDGMRAALPEQSQLPNQPLPQSLHSTHHTPKLLPHFTPPLPPLSTPLSTAGNPLLTHLPSRKLLKGAGAHNTTTPQPQLQPQQQQQPHRQQLQQPQQQQLPTRSSPPMHVQAAAAQLDQVNGPPVPSKLNTIVMSYLRQMHRQACMQSNTPVAVLPPVPLSKPYSLPQPPRVEEAPTNVTRRMALRETASGRGMHGGRGGAKANRQMIYSRFRPLRTFRCDSSISMCAAFCANTNMLVVGSHSGELTAHDVHAGEIIDAYEAHLSPTTMLRSKANIWGADPDATLLLSSCKNEVKLWDGLSLAHGAVATWEGATKASFNSNATQAIGVLVQPGGAGSTSNTRKAAIWDVRTHQQLLTFEEMTGTGGNALLGSPGTDQRHRSVPAPCFAPSPDSPLVLWGASLWDVRCPPRVLHTFDMFSDTRATSSCFNPAGHPEAILNSEVWDLRTFKLLRSVPALDGTQLTFSGDGSVAYATLRRTSEELGSLLAPRRARHNLHSAFRVLDSSTWGELATVDVERAVVDLATEESDSLLAVVCLDSMDSTLSSNVRLLEVGRQRQADDSSDEDDDDDSQSGEEDSEDIMDSELLSSDGEGDTPATTPHQRNRNRHRLGANGEQLIGAARRLAGALGRMERQQEEQEGAGEGSDSDGWDDEEAELRAQIMEGMDSPFSALEDGEEEGLGGTSDGEDIGSEDDEDDEEDEDDEGYEDSDEELDSDFDSAEYDEQWEGEEGEGSDMSA